MNDDKIVNDWIFHDQFRLTDMHNPVIDVIVQQNIRKERSIICFHKRDALHRITLLAFIAKHVKSPARIYKTTNVIIWSCRQENYRSDNSARPSVYLRRSDLYESRGANLISITLCTESGIILAFDTWSLWYFYWHAYIRWIETKKCYYAHCSSFIESRKIVSL